SSTSFENTASGIGSSTSRTYVMSPLTAPPASVNPVRAITSGSPGGTGGADALRSKRGPDHGMPPCYESPRHTRRQRDGAHSEQRRARADAPYLGWEPCRSPTSSTAPTLSENPTPT